MSSIDTIVMRVGMKDLARPGTYDGYVQSGIYPEAQAMWDFFLWAHPEYLTIKSGEDGIEYAIPKVNFEQALASKNNATLKEAAEIIYDRARRQYEIAHLAVSAYDEWRRKNKDMIVTDYGTVRPDTDFEGMYAYEMWKRANLGSVLAEDVAISSPSSAEDYAEAA